ncbi:MAG: hypothetical protein K9M10_02630 [Candidatus Pacebacteria bacterium]|nr:hypothetical protein [Candidatus Paceibacterota bacterium]MCF7857351.1 hypothetical protein [Candidatus Paceibacterota bacterium]
MKVRQIKKMCLLFGEGGKEEIFFRFLENSNRFKNRFPDWGIEMSHASGEACSVILQKCINFTSKRGFDLVICFIDTDKLQEHGSRSEEEKNRLEQLATEHRIKIIWQDPDHESELSRATNGRIKGKAGMRRRLENNLQAISKSAFIRRIFAFFPNE